MEEETARLAAGLETEALIGRFMGKAGQEGARNFPARVTPLEEAGTGRSSDTVEGGSQPTPREIGLVELLTRPLSPGPNVPAM